MVPAKIDETFQIAEILDEEAVEGETVQIPLVWYLSLQAVDYFHEKVAKHWIYIPPKLLVASEVSGDDERCEGGHRRIVEYQYG